ncbi:MAG TPA: dihydrolipoamide acetyltransferase family protein [Chloroflexota bacterium]|nr:dihydrolipoamide acetyltransferase family protein [Chloroflexota bacterium]
MPDVTMPRLSDTMQEGKIARWLKHPGDRVAPGDVLAEIETDKATMELEAYDAGVLERILVPEGQNAPIGQAIAVIGTGAAANGSGSPAAPSGRPAGAAATSTAPAPSEAGPAARASGQPPVGANPPAVQQETRPPTDAAGGEPAAQSVGMAPAQATTGGAPPEGAGTAPAQPATSGGTPAGGVRASPMARAIARERGIDLRTIHGSGPGGRVIRADVEAASGNGHAPAPPSAAPPAPAAAEAARPPAPPVTTPAGPAAPSATAAPAAPSEDVEVRPVGRVHQLMAERTLLSVREIPQYYLTAEIDMQAALDLRRQLEATFGGEPRITINAIVLRAVALALREVPEVNSVWRDGQWTVHRRVNLGMAVAIPDGLIVPVIRDADRKSLREIAVESRALASRARDGKLSLPEVQGGTFSVTNLGMFDVEEFHGIINPPEAGLLAVGTTVEKPVGLDGQIVLRPRMRVTLTADHRAYSGDVGARFLQAVKRLLEQPLRLGF